MRYKVTAPAALAAGLLLGLAAGPLLSTRSAASPDPQPPKAQQWEYLLIPANEAVPVANDDAERKASAEKGSANFTKVGGDGWEYAGQHMGSGTLNAVFKRPRR